MPRKLLLFAAIAVLGSMLILWIVTRKTAAEEVTAEPETVAITHPDGEQDLRGTRPALPADPSSPVATDKPPSFEPGIPRNDDPARPKAATVEPTERGSAEAAKPFKEYTLPDGRRVRDFRDPSTAKPMEIPPSIHPPGGRRIKPELTSLYSEQILAHMHECGTSVPQSALGKKPRLEGQIVIGIKAQQGTVASAVFKLTDVTDPAIAETAKQCIEQKALTVKVAATDEPDLDAYSINLSFVFP